jgi:hypothetical protein
MDAGFGVFTTPGNREITAYDSTWGAVVRARNLSRVKRFGKLVVD